MKRCWIISRITLISATRSKRRYATRSPKNSSLLDSHDDEDEAGRIETEGADSADTSEKPAKKPSAKATRTITAEFSPEDIE